MSIRLVKFFNTFCNDNRERLENIQTACCFYCKTAAFKVSEIREWVGKKDRALCPKCGIDSVLPQRIKHCVGDEMEEYIVTKDDLEEMRVYWF